INNNNRICECIFCLLLLQRLKQPRQKSRTPKRANANTNMYAARGHILSYMETPTKRSARRGSGGSRRRYFEDPAGVGLGVGCGCRGDGSAPFTNLYPAGIRSLALLVGTVEL